MVHWSPSGTCLKSKMYFLHVSRAPIFTISISRKRKIKWILREIAGRLPVSSLNMSTGSTVSHPTTSQGGSCPGLRRNHLHLMMRTQASSKLVRMRYPALRLQFRAARGAARQWNPLCPAPNRSDTATRGFLSGLTNINYVESHLPRRRTPHLGRTKQGSSVWFQDCLGLYAISSSRVTMF